MTDGCFGDVEVKFPDTIYVGKGLAFLFKGWFFSTSCDIRKMALMMDDERIPVHNIRQPRADVISHFARQGTTDKKVLARALKSGFSSIIELREDLAGKTKIIKLTACLSNGEEVIVDEKIVYFQKEEEYYRPLKLQQNGPDGPLVAICMATYAPAVVPFKRQIDSIRNQTYKNWVCIINDDASGNEFIKAIREVVGDDGRFYVFENETNLGFYQNFEKALTYVPTKAKFVALADQDDFWYPDKVEKCVNMINSDPQLLLVYSDMRIVESDGKVIADTYWVNRKNYYKELDLLLIANTVTGAASLFRQELLSTVLPFPQKIGGSFHDHVIACASLVKGKIGYIDEPLYNYIQYEQNVIGHCDFDGTKESGFRKLMGPSFASFGDAILHAVGHLLSVYENEYRRITLLSRTLLMRSRSHDDALRIFNDRCRSVLKLLLIHLKVRWRKETTDNAELRLLAAYILARTFNRWFPFLLKAKLFKLEWLP